MQKSSNTVALVESFLGEIKPDDESTPEPVLPNKTNVKIIIEENKDKPIDDSQLPKEALIDNVQISLKFEDKVSNKIETCQPNTADVFVSEVKSEITTKETIEASIVPIVEKAPSPPPPPPVKRKVSYFLDNWL